MKNLTKKQALKIATFCMQNIDRYAQVKIDAYLEDYFLRSKEDRVVSFKTIFEWIIFDKIENDYLQSINDVLNGCSEATSNTLDCTIEVYKSIIQIYLNDEYLESLTNLIFHFTQSKTLIDSIQEAWTVLIKKKIAEYS